ncbi:MAG TPA: hypothetical protein VEH04_06305 [Verrucomicrobiae bacterium]|nr:hypothetical protein [Verrucomicrobiae bacterium]
MNPQGKPAGRGCLFYAGVAVAISVLVLVAASYLGYRYAKGLVIQFTDTQPTVRAAPAMAASELNALHDRITTFIHSVQEGTALAPLRISEAEANALFASGTNWRTVRGTVVFDFDGSNVLAQFSIPAEDLGLKPLVGRYVNASGVFTVGVSNGLLNINAQSLSSKGEPLPETFMNRISPQNFAFKLNQDPEAKPVIERMEAVRVEDGELVIIPRP